MMNDTVPTEQTLIAGNMHVQNHFVTPL